MKIVSVLGSPRMAGNTATVLGWVEAQLKADGHELEHLNVIDYEMSGCTNCNTCKLEPSEPGCILEDDVDMLLKKFMAADLVLLATPLYCWGFSSQLKILIDRCYSLKKPGPDGGISLVKGKYIALLVTCAGPYEGNAELLDLPFNRIAWFMQTQIAGTLYVTNCSRPEDLGADQRRQAVEFARQLSGVAASA
jgi:multimeric flavodoxin WrbA